MRGLGVRLPSIGSATRLVLLCLLVVCLFLGLMLAATEAHFVAPIVDFYVVAQYARAMAEGHPFQYNAGEPGTTGSTSLLHTAVLALAHALGARGEGLVAFAMLLGAACYVTSTLLSRRIGERAAGPRTGGLAGAMVALGGPVVWGFLYGSDVALFMLLSLLLLERMLAEWERPAPYGILSAGALIGLARPEGLPLGLVLGAALILLGPARTLGWRIAAWAPGGAGLLVLSVNRWATGSWLGTSMADKSLVDAYGVTESLGLLAAYGQDVLRGLLLGFYPAQARVGFAEGFSPFFLPPLGLLLVLTALANPAPAVRTPLRVFAGMVALVFVLVSPNVFMGVHFNRYLLFAFPALLALTAVGLEKVTAGLANGEAAVERRYHRLGAGACLVFGLLSTLRFASIYADMAGSVYRRDVAAARFISEKLPRGVTMANLATSVEYLTGHRNVNLHGVTSPAFLGNRKAEREAGMLESLRRLPREERPPYLITSVSAQAGHPVLAELVDPVPLFETSSFSDEIQIFRTRYAALEHGENPLAAETREAIQGLAEVDRLNLCDSEDERRHRYGFRSGLGNLRLYGTARGADQVVDGVPVRVIDAGRAILGEETFEARVRPGRNLTIVLRSAGGADVTVLRASGSGRFHIDLAEAQLRVEVEGRTVTSSAWRPGPGWDERVLRIPAEHVAGERIQIRVVGRYVAYRYWLFQ
jgi:hypothetical protein